MGELSAGAGAVALPMPPGAPLMGYAARQGLSTGCHDPLFARALYLRNGSDLLVVECDVCLIAPAQADAVRARISARTGIPSARILVGCIHTHSGPETGFAAMLGGGEPPEWVASILSAAEEAGVTAFREAAPARLGIAHARARIGRNRRRADGPVDEDVLVLRVDRAGGAPLAVAYVHGCHPTVLGHDNLAYSADWPGAAARVIAEALPGALPLFLLGAHADVDPRTRGLQDLAQSGQSAGAGFDAVEQLGREIGRAVAEAARTATLRADVPVFAAAARLRLATHRASADQRLAALRALELPDDHPAGTGELFRLERERTAHLPDAERRERIARVRGYLRGRVAARFAGGEAPEVEAQLLAIGDARLLALPAEATVDVGLDWKARCGTPHAAVVSIANGWLRYLPHPRNYEEPLAHQSYEVLNAALAPDAAARLLAAGERLAAGVPGAAP